MLSSKIEEAGNRDLRGDLKLSPCHPKLSEIAGGEALLQSVEDEYRSLVILNTEPVLRLSLLLGDVAEYYFKESVGPAINRLLKSSSNSLLDEMESASHWVMREKSVPVPVKGAFLDSAPEEMLRHFLNVLSFRVAYMGIGEEHTHPCGAEEDTLSSVPGSLQCAQFRPLRRFLEGPVHDIKFFCEKAFAVTTRWMEQGCPTNESRTPRIECWLGTTP